MKSPLSKTRSSPILSPDIHQVSRHIGTGAAVTIFLAVAALTRAFVCGNLLRMTHAESIHPVLLTRLVEGLYVEAMVLADEARSYFDGPCEPDRQRMETMERLTFTCESLKVTTRLMHVLAWLLTHKAWQKGEIGWDELSDPKYLLGEADPTEASILSSMPEPARALILASEDLYERVRRLQDSIRAHDEADIGHLASPARNLLSRLETHY